MTYEIQGRRTIRGPVGAPREVVRLDTADERAVAFAIAEAMATERLTVWVFERTPQLRSGPAYTLLATMPAKT
jgi:hypothetical protein